MPKDSWRLEEKSLEITLPERIRIFDTTLRDGEQTPGVALTPEDKVVIARQLDRLGVDVIEAGFPISSPGEANAVVAVAKQGLKPEIIGLARTARGDIDAALKCDLRSVHVFVATSDIHLQYKLKLTRDQVLQKAVENVEYSKNHGLTVEFSAEDASRTDIDFLKRIYRAVVEVGADRINVPDTVGVMTPGGIRHLISELKKEIRVPISMHCHNDFGLAVANSLAGCEAGAEQVHVAVNGLGERAGNASLEEVVMALYSLHRKKTSVDTTMLYETSRIVSRLTGVIVQPNKAIVGENAFAHESGIHTHGVASLPLTYEPLSPDLVGRTRLLVSGKHAGAHGIRKELEDLGLELDDAQLKDVTARVKELGDKGKLVTTTDLISIASIVRGQAVKGPEAVSLKDLTVVTGSSVIPTASVKLYLLGKEYVVSDTGIGPVDAAMKAIQKLTDSAIDVRLKEFRLEALTGGSNAVAEVVVKVEDKTGNVVSARAAHPDIVMASVEAMINGMNRLLAKTESQRSR